MTPCNPPQPVHNALALNCLALHIAVHTHAVAMRAACAEDHTDRINGRSNKTSASNAHAASAAHPAHAKQKHSAQASHLAVFFPKPVSNALALNCLKALEIQYALSVFVTGRIPLPCCFHVCHASLQYALHINNNDVHTFWRMC